jgi:hypothetical protein
LSLIAVAVLVADIGALVLATGVAYLLRFRLGWGPELAPNRFLFFAPVNLTLIVSSVLSGLALGSTRAIAPPDPPIDWYAPSASSRSAHC